MQRRSSVGALTVAIVMIWTCALRANSGTQLPLSQYQAGTEVATLVPNGGFEAATGGDADAPWVESGGGMSVGAHLGPNASAAILGSNAASAAAFDLTRYRQSVTFNPGVSYVLSGYVWNYGVPGPAPHNPSDFDPGDQAVVELLDASNFVNFLLEPIALDGGSGANGYYCYATIPANTFPGATNLDVRCDLDTLGPWPGIVMQFDNIAITPESLFVPPSLIPEPASASLIVGGLLLAAARRRRN